MSITTSYDKGCEEEILKFLDVSVIYFILDNKWVYRCKLFQIDSTLLW
jgi:hypothetical protein